jgi:hypothetical protein
MTQGRIVYRYNSYDSTQNDVETTELWDVETE